MIRFRNSKILFDSEGLGEKFRQARSDAGVKIEKAAADLSINTRYLEALESGCLHELPAGLYRKNIVSSYAHYLAMDTEEIIELFGREDAVECDERRRSVFSRKVPHISFFLPTPKILRSAILLVVVTICVGYLGLCFKKIISPPRLTVFSPASEIVVGRLDIDVRGATDPKAEVVINGEPVLTDLSGNFSKMVNLKTGLNTILVSAQKKYSPKNSVLKQILVKSGG